MSLAPPKPSTLVPGYRLDRYELLCPVARGGMAEVWVARLRGKHGFEKLVAIKTILPQFAQEPSFQKMFLDEAHIASGIEHQNVAQILDLGEQHDVLYIVMEWVDGDAMSKLQRACEKKSVTIPIGVVLRILADTCGGLHSAHELHDKEGNDLHVVHRDVSPQNILVSNKGVAKLIDFGIAKARDRLGGETNSGTLKGKIHYMAPEQALGKPIDRRADVWAVGAILYHVLSGRPAYEGDNQLATLHLLASGKPPPPLPKSVPEPVAEVVRRSLKHDPDKRLATAAELQKALESAMAEAWIHTSTADVATFVADHMADRADNRRKAIDLALRQASEREKMLQALSGPNSAESSSGITDVPGKLARAMSPSALPKDLKVPSPAIEIDLPPPGPTVPPIAETSAATTLGSSLLEPAALPPSPAGRRRVAVLGVVGAAAALLVVGATIALLRGGGNGSAGAPQPASEKDHGGSDRRASPKTPSDDPEPPASGAATGESTTIASGIASGSASASDRPPTAASTTKPPPPAYTAAATAPTGTGASTVKPKPSATATVKKKPIDDGF